jgi:myo-inositol-1(or 4)-monophosphatase
MQEESFIKASFEACKEIASVLTQGDKSLLFEEHSKGYGGDISIGADLIAEKILYKYLSSFGKILSEESGYLGDGDYTIIIDPLDGSDNFKSQFPYYGTSIALVENAKTLCGIVCNLVSGEFFVRSDDTLTCKNIFNLTCKTFTPSLSAIGLFEKAYYNPEVAVILKENNLKFRSPGAVALSLAYAHYVKYVLFLGTMRDYDIVAGMHICKSLYTYKDDTCIIISKDKTTFEKLCKLIILKDNS